MSATLSLTLFSLSLLPQAPASVHDLALAARRIQIVPMDEVLTIVPAARGLPLTSLAGFDHLGPGTWRLLGKAGNEEEPGPRQLIEPDDLVNLVRESMPALFEVEGTGIELRGKSLVITGPAETTIAVRTQARALARKLARPVHVKAELFRLDARSEGLAAVATPAQVAQATANLQRVCTVSEQTYLGLPVELRRFTQVAFVKDADVEIAQSSTTPNPVTAAITEGLLLAAEVHAAPGSSDLVLLCQFAAGERNGAITSFATNSPDLVSIDLPRINLGTGTCSGRIPNGGSLVVTLQNRNGPGYLLVISANAAAAEEKGAESTAVIPIGVLTSLALRRQIHASFGLGMKDAKPYQDLQLEIAEDLSAEPIEGDALVELVKSALGEEVEKTFVMRLPTCLVVRGSETARKAALEVVQTLSAQAMRTADVAASLLPEGAGADARVLTVRGPMLLARHHLLLHGLEIALLHDYECEVAQKARIFDPKVDSTVSGLTLVLTPIAADNGLAAEGAVLASHADEPRRRPLEGKSSADLFLSDLRHAGANLRGLIGPEPRMLGDGPEVMLEGRRVRTHLQLTVTELAAPR